MTQDEDDDTVWHATVDRGTWECNVIGTAEGQGILTVKRASDGTVILEKPVPLAYGAIFGPDVDDVAQWQDTALKAIDAHT